MQILLSNPPRSRRRKARRSSKKRRRVAKRTARRYSAAPAARTRKRRRRRNPFAALTTKRRRRRRRASFFSGVPTVARKKHRRKSRRRSGGFSRRAGGFVYIPSKSELKDGAIAAVTVLGLDKLGGYVIPQGLRDKLNAQSKYGGVAASAGLGLVAAGVVASVGKNKQLGSMIALGTIIKGVVDTVLIAQGKQPTNFSGLVDSYPGMYGYVDSGVSGFVDQGVAAFNE